MLKRTKPLVAKTTLKAKKKLTGKVGLKSVSVLKTKSPLRKQNVAAKNKWDEARKICLERDKYKCRVCGKEAEEVHHIHLRSARRDLLYSPNNLISLCKQHHIHSASEGYIEQCRLIAIALGITVEELLKNAEN